MKSSPRYLVNWRAVVFVYVASMAIFVYATAPTTAAGKDGITPLGAFVIATIEFSPIAVVASVIGRPLAYSKWAAVLPWLVLITLYAILFSFRAWN
jgi:hypothetical protein